MHIAAQIPDFLTRYRELANSLRGQEADEFILRSGKLLGSYQLAIAEYEIWESKHASDYNIFEVLNIKQRETLTHTPFLGNLLSPNGSHAQGMLFYSSFINAIVPDVVDASSFIPEGSNDLTVIEELGIGNGFIDIFISGIAKEKRFVIIIENKIDAVDQHRQLQRYWEYASEVLKLDSQQILMVYLTKDGRAPHDTSIDPEKRKGLEKAGSYVQISYRSDVKEWLESCEPKARIIVDSIKQYILTISKF